jgi:putative membrane protein
MSRRGKGRTIKYQVGMEAKERQNQGKTKKRQSAKKRTNLATERTELANERTLLAYGRTAFSMIVVGLSLLEFFDRARYQWIGIALIPLGILVAIVGYVRYSKKKKIIEENSLDSYSDEFKDQD